MIQRHRLVVFYLLAYVISWIPGFAYAALAARGSFSSPAVPVLLLLATSYGPALAALLMLALLRDPKETQGFRHHLSAWRAGVGWYILALILPAALWAAGSLLASAEFGGIAFLPAAAAAFPALLLANAGEEIGWRGFAFPHLLAGLKPIPASLVFGVLWAGIHLPLYVTALDRFAILIPMFVGLSVLMAWIFLNTGQGLLPMLVFHSSLDTSQFVLPLDQTTHGFQSFATIMLLTVAAALIVIWRAPSLAGRSQA
jgi:membrane protease YdiL (CAAX protease family)